MVIGMSYPVAFIEAACWESSTRNDSVDESVLTGLKDWLCGWYDLLKRVNHTFPALDNENVDHRDHCYDDYRTQKFYESLFRYPSASASFTDASPLVKNDAINMDGGIVYQEEAAPFSVVHSIEDIAAKQDHRVEQPDVVHSFHSPHPPPNAPHKLRSNTRPNDTPNLHSRCYNSAPTATPKAVGLPVDNKVNLSPTLLKDGQPMSFPSANAAISNNGKKEPEFTTLTEIDERKDEDRIKAEGPQTGFGFGGSFPRKGRKLVPPMRLENVDTA